METKKHNIKTIIIAAVVLIALLVGAVVLYQALNSDSNEALKTITVEVVFGENDTKTYTAKTEGKYLVDALKKLDILTDADIAKGYITTLAGVTADVTKEEWWQVLKDGVQTSLGMNEQPIADGEKYEIRFTVGFDY